MPQNPFNPTPEQGKVVCHKGSAFVTACPGAGKTRVLVERARHEMRGTGTEKGMAFLSFTSAAISELKTRLQSERILPNPVFPNYVGTFDTFMWQFFIAPLGIPGQICTPLLMPDMDERPIVPYPQAQPLQLSCFDRSGNIIPEKAKLAGYDATAKPGLTAKYEASARGYRKRCLAKGELGFSDVRGTVKEYLSNAELSGRLSKALAARFGEIVVDEAQDCNTEDIEIIKWFRSAGIAIKIICDPHQSIYGFRGGVSQELFKLRETFGPSEQLSMTGNFRSSPNICKAIVAFRAKDQRETKDEAVGPAATDQTKIYILSYSGKSVPDLIGRRFKELLKDHGLSPLECPVISSTWNAACKAIGQNGDTNTNDRTTRLALAVMGFHHGMEINARKSAMESLHEITLEVGEKLVDKTYHQFLHAERPGKENWRPEVLTLLRALQFDALKDKDAATWLERARTLMTPYLGISGSIAQKLRKNQELASILSSKPTDSLSARTIHSVKGMEFPGVCVVLTSTKCKEMIDYLTTGEPVEAAENARKLYVAASRAKRILVIAVPKSQGNRLVSHVNLTGADIIHLTLSSETT